MRPVLATGNVFTKVSNSTPEVDSLVRNVLSYQVENHEIINRKMQKKWHTSRKWDGIKSFYDRRNHYFLTGFLPMVKDALCRSSIPVDYADMRVKPVSLPSMDAFQLKGITLHDFQERTIQDFLGAGRGVAQLATGAGKTEVAIALTKGLHLRTIFMTHRVNLLHQTVRRFIKRCPDLRSHIGVIGDKTYEPKDITFAMVQTLYSLIKKDPAQMRDELKDYRFVIIDEAHRSGASQFHVPAMCCTNAYFRLALTATPFMKRNVADNMYLMGVAGDVITKVTNGELIERGILARPFFKFFHINSPDIRRLRNWRDIYERGIIYNDTRNSIIVNQASRLTDMKRKTLVIVNERVHGQLLEQKIQEKGVRVKYVDGGNDYSEREAALSGLRKDKLDMIVATNIFDEGIDVNDINAVILAAGTKSPPALFQRTGRAIRKKEEENYAIILDFIDDTHRHLLEHSQVRYDLVKNEAGFTIL